MLSTGWLCTVPAPAGALLRRRCAVYRRLAVAVAAGGARVCVTFKVNAFIQRLTRTIQCNFQSKSVYTETYTEWLSCAQYFCWGIPHFPTVYCVRSTFVGVNQIPQQFYCTASIFTRKNRLRSNFWARPPLSDFLSDS